MEQVAIQQRFRAALEGLVGQIQQDTSILAAILCGSLSHDVVWEKSDIDLVLVAVDDKKVSASDVPVFADGVNVHINLIPRAAFRRLVEGSLHNSFMHSLLAKGRLLYTHDETIAELWGRKDYTTISPGALSDFLARKVLRPVTRRRILERTRQVLRRNYPLVEAWAGRRGDALRMVPPRAGAIAYLHYAWRLNSSELVVRLRDEKSVLVVPGDHFGMDGYLRLGFGERPDYLRQGLDRVHDLLSSLALTSASS